MCELMGNEPLDEEIPITLSDFPEEIQICLELYYKIPDRWEYMSGTYLGKDLACFSTIADIMEIEDKKHTLEIILLVDSVRMDYLLTRQKNKPKEVKNGV